MPDALQLAAWVGVASFSAPLWMACDTELLHTWFVSLIIGLAFENAMTYSF